MNKLEIIKEECKNEYIQFRNRLINYGYEENENGIILLYNDCLINSNIAKSYYSTGESWDNVNFSNDERILAQKIHQLSNENYIRSFQYN